MRAMMQAQPLRSIDILTFAALAFPEQGIVSMRKGSA